MRIVCLDLGEKRIGIARSDELGVTAQGVGVIERQSREKDLASIKRVIDDAGAEVCVIGLPRNMDGTYGAGAEKARRFARGLEESTGVRTVLQDERMTTQIATRALIEADVSRKKRRGSVDMLAAQVILQSYLDSIRASDGTSTSRTAEVPS